MFDWLKEFLESELVQNHALVLLVLATLLVVITCSITRKVVVLMQGIETGRWTKLNREFKDLENKHKILEDECRLIKQKYYSLLQERKVEEELEVIERTLHDDQNVIEPAFRQFTNKQQNGC